MSRRSAALIAFATICAVWALLAWVFVAPSDDVRNPPPPPPSPPNMGATAAESQRASTVLVATPDGVEPEMIRRENLPVTPMQRLVGTLRRGGRPLADRSVICEPIATGPPVSVTTAADGRFEFDVTPGDHHLRVPRRQGTHEPRLGSSLPVSDTESPQFAVHARVTIAAGEPATRHDLELPTGSITVRLLDSNSLRLVTHPGSVVLTPERPSAEVLRVSTDSTGIVRIEDLDAGTYTLAGTARAYRSAIQSVTLDDVAVAAHVDLRLEPTCALDFVFVDERGEPLELSLVSAEFRLLDWVKAVLLGPSNHAAFERDPPPRVIEFDDLDPDSYTPGVFGDREELEPERAVRFDAITIVSELPRDIELNRGEWRIVRILARRRCHARLRGVDADGATADATLTVTLLDRAKGRVLVRPTRKVTGAADVSNHFEGHLDTGRYELRFRRGSLEHTEDLLVVDGEPLVRAFVLPW